jgi:hypothetical protein
MPQTVTFTIEEEADLTHVEPNVQNISSAHVITTGTLFLCDVTSGSFTISLPVAANNKNRVITVKRIDASGNTLTVNTDDSALIDGAASTTVTTQWDSISVQSDGTDWFIK